MINMKEYFEELNKLDKEELFEMANIRAKQIKIEDLDFSFYFSSKADVNNQHSIRVKLCWDKEKIGKDLIDGTLELHGDYEYHRSSNPVNKHLSQIDLDTARYFFKRYKVLFAAVWEGVLDENDMVSYLRGQITFEDLLKLFEVSDEELKLISIAKNRKELEKIVRENNIFNMND